MLLLCFYDVKIAAVHALDLISQLFFACIIIETFVCHVKVTRSSKELIC